MKDAINALTEGVESLAEESHVLRLAVAEIERKRERDSNVTKALWVLVGMVTVFTVALFALYTTRSTANSTRLGNIEDLVTTVEGCFTPDGECAQANDESTREVFVQLIEVNKIIVLCSRTNPTEEQFNRCVDKRTADLLKGPTP